SSDLVDGHTQRARRVEQVRHINKDTHALRRWERRQRDRDVSRGLIGATQFGHHAIALQLNGPRNHVGEMIDRACRDDALAITNSWKRRHGTALRLITVAYGAREARLRREDAAARWRRLRPLKWPGRVIALVHLVYRHA